MRRLRKLLEPNQFRFRTSNMGSTGAFPVSEIASAFDSIAAMIAGMLSSAWPRPIRSTSMESTPSIVFTELRAETRSQCNHGLTVIA